jgi:sugar phosphate isomerase/epimerase
MIISAFSCHYEPLSPNEELASESDKIFRKSVRLASLLEVPVVNVLSSLPAGAPGDQMPNWVTCPWPPHKSSIPVNQVASLLAFSSGCPAHGVRSG